MRRLSVVVGLGLGLLHFALASAAMGQVASGNVTGRIVDEKGLPMTAVTITAGGPAIPQPRRSASNVRGEFLVVGLPLGTYRLRAEGLGRRPVIIEGVEVALGRTTSVGVLVLPATAIELGAIVINAAARPLIDPSSAALESNFTNEAFSRVPTDRSFRSIVTLSPLATESFFPGDEANIGGGSGFETAWFVDGTNMTDVFVSPAGAGSANLPYNFVRQITVRAGGYEAEFGRSMGGVVNAVTQSGSDDWHGQLFGFFTGDRLTAAPRYSGTASDLQTFSAYDVGASVGGPIVRNRLWFFGAYNPSFRRVAVRVKGLTDVPPDLRTDHLLAGKLNWEPTPQTHVQLTVLGDPSVHHSLEEAQQWDSVGSLGAVYTIWHRGGSAVSLAAERQLARNVRLEGSVADVMRRNDQDPALSAEVAGQYYSDLRTNYAEGAFYGGQRFRARRLAARAALTAALATHTIKGGIEYEDNFLDLVINTGFEHAGATGGIMRLDSATWAWMKWYGAGKLHNHIPTAYVQDSWRASPRLTLNAGVRVERQTLLSSTGKPFLTVRHEPQPRLGFVFEPGTLGSQRVFGSYGRFYEQFPLNPIVASNGFSLGHSWTVYDHDPRVDSTGGQATVDPITTAGIPPGRRVLGSSYDQVNAGYERLITRSIRAGVQIMRRELRWAVENAYNVDSGYWMMGNPGRGNLSFVPRATHRYTALTFALDKPHGQRSMWHLSYTLSRSLGNYDGLYDYQGDSNNPNMTRQFDGPESIPNSRGLLSNDREQVFKLNGSYRINEGFTLGLAGSVMTGLPRNDLGATSDGLGQRYLVPRGSVGRSQVLKDLNLRLAQALPLNHSRLRPTVQLDIFHVLNGREAAVVDDVHYTYVDASGNQAGPNPRYARGLYYQPPRSVRLGLLVEF